MPSHYCSQSSTRLYIEPIFESITEMFEVYKTYCKEEETKEDKPENYLVLSRHLFDAAFEKMNLSIYQLKKDKCDTCSSYEVGNLSEEEYLKHTDMKNVARGEKESDKQKAKYKKLHAFTSDLESVKVAPFVKASAFYYATKLVAHNFTMYNLDTKQVKCFWFDETAASLKASVFASCVVSKIEEILSNDPKPVVLWSKDVDPKTATPYFPMLC